MTLQRDQMKTNKYFRKSLDSWLGVFSPPCRQHSRHCESSPLNPRGDRWCQSRTVWSDPWRRSGCLTVWRRGGWRRVSPSDTTTPSLSAEQKHKQRLVKVKRARSQRVNLWLTATVIFPRIRSGIGPWILFFSFSAQVPISSIAMKTSVWTRKHTHT